MKAELKKFIYKEDPDKDREAVMEERMERMHMNETK